MNVFQQVWEWLVANIVPLLTTANVTAVVVIIGQLITAKRNLKANTEVSAELKKELKVIDTAKELLYQLDRQVATVQVTEVTQGEKTDDALTALLEKLNAILEIQHIAYNAEELEGVKDAINNVYNNAKFATTQARRQLKAAMEESEAIMQKAAEEAAKPLKKARQLVEPEYPDTPKISV